MFNISTYFKFIFGLLILGITCNHLLALHRNSELGTIEKTQNKTEIIAKLGAPAEVINCQTDTSTSSAISGTDLCRENAYEVDAFPRCYFRVVCPGWNYVIFDQAGKPLYTYAWIAPLFPGGPAL